jgi:hypothetical protein
MWGIVSLLEGMPKQLLTEFSSVAPWRRLMAGYLHTEDMLHNGAKSVVIRANDTDVVVLAVSLFQELRSKGLRELWVLYGAGDHNQRYFFESTTISRGNCEK